MLDSSKQAFIKQFSKSANDTGSVEVQCAVLTNRIGSLSEHLKSHKNDFSSRRGLLVMVGRRKRLLRYLKEKSEQRYGSLIKQLDVRG